MLTNDETCMISWNAVINPIFQQPLMIFVIFNNNIVIFTHTWHIQYSALLLQDDKMTKFLQTFTRKINCPNFRG